MAVAVAAGVASLGLASAALASASRAPATPPRAPVLASSTVAPATVAPTPAAPAPGAHGVRGATPAVAPLRAELPRSPLTVAPWPSTRGWWRSPLAWPRPPVRRAFRPPAHPWSPGHRGIDLAGRRGAPVYAVADGVVVYAGPVAGVPIVSIAHRDGVRSTYQPVLAGVRAGDPVRRGQVIGTLTDIATHCAPTCLHLGARRGDGYLDPALLLHWRGPRLLPLTVSPAA